jgi:propionyl-CoA carboxylase beta chain
MDKIEILDQNTDKIIGASSKIRAFLDLLLDEKSLVETDIFLSGKNFLDGSDALGEGAVTGYAFIGGNPVYLFAHSEVLSGSASRAQADKIVKNIYAAEKAGVPFISIIDSAGARIGEGIGVSEGYSKIIKAALDISGSVPHIAVVKGNCIGMTSVYAACADFVLADETAKISVSSPTVLAAKSKIGADVFSAKTVAAKTVSVTALYKTGEELKQKLTELLKLLPSDDSYVSADGYTDGLNRETDSLNQKVTPYGLFEAVLDDGAFVELYADFAKEVKCALGRIAGVTVAAAAFDPELNKFITLDAVKKLSKFLYSTSAFNIPFISFVDSKGIEPSAESEYSGLAAAAAELLTNIASSDNRKISVIVGNAIGFAYSALASKGIGFDYVFSTVDGVISPINPEVATVLLYDEELKNSKDPIAKRAELDKKYGEEAANPYIAAKDGYVDNIIEPALIRAHVASALTMLV